MAKETNELLGHSNESDGIEEYDNPLPDWWLGLFGITIVWGIAYGISFHFIEGDSQVQRYDEAVAAAAERWPQSDEAPTFAMSDELVAEGEGLYAQHCASCHNADMTGLVGPSLIDAEWIHGSSPDEVVHTITNGVLVKAMPAWGPVLGNDGVQAVAAYVIANRDPNTVDVPREEPAAAAVVADTEPTAAEPAAEGEGEGEDVAVVDAEPEVLDPSITGESLFAANCTACHGADMTGGVGPSLVDSEWIRGGDLESIKTVITEGVPEKGMISWGPILGAQKIELVAQYVHEQTAE